MNRKETKKIEKIKKLIADGEIDKALEIADAHDIQSLFKLGASFGKKGENKVAEKIFNKIITINPNIPEVWYNKGLILINLGKYDVGIKCFDEAIKINPNLVEAWTNKGSALGKLGKHDEEIKCYEQAIKINPNLAEAWYNKGITLAKLEKYDEAVKCFDEVIKINPDYDKAWYNKGAILEKLGKPDEAITCYGEAVRINPHLVEAWYNKGAALAKLEKYDEAIKCYDQVIKINPENDHAWYNKGIALAELEKYDEAIKCYDEVIRINPNFAGVWSNKGSALEYLGKHDEAIKCYDEAIKINANDAAAWSNKGSALVNLGKLDEAIKCFDQAIKINTNNDTAWYNKGVALANLGKYDEEIKCYDEAIRINPNHDEAWTNKGSTLVNLGKYDEAIKCFDQAIKINPDYDKALFNKGIALGELGKYDEAIKCYDEAIEINPNLAEAWSNKGVALGKIGKHDQSITCFDEAIKINPKDDIAWSNKGVALRNLGKHDEALKCFDQALKINPNLAATWSNKGVALGKLKKHDEEIKCYEEAIKINPYLAAAWSNKGATLGNLGKHDEAIKCFDQAIKINPYFAAAWLNKGAALGKLEKHDEEIKCYEEAIKIEPTYAEAYGNLGITFLNIHEYDKAATELKKAKELFSKRGLKKEAEQSHKYELWASNASELMSSLNALDEQFIAGLNSSSLTELKEKSLHISKGIEGVVKEFEKREMPEDVNKLLINKAICFTDLSSALKFEKVDLKKLEDTKTVFEKWGFDTFVIAVNSVDSFIRALNKYNNLEEIPEEVEKLLLKVLGTSYYLDGKLTEEITDKFKGEPPYAAKPIGIEIKKEPEIIYKNIADTEKEWVRFCLVQLDFSLKPQPPSEEFGYILEETDKIKNKVFQALEVAEKQQADVICFPELSFARDWVEEIKNQYKDMIIIGGSYYDGEYNVCPIIIDGETIDPPYRKCSPSPMENPAITGRGMKSGNIIYIFQTKCGRFSFLTCIDYTTQSDRVRRYDDTGVDFIINPCCDENLFRFQPRCNSDCQDFGIDVIQVNKATKDDKYGKSCIIGKEHKTILQRLKDDGFKPEDNIEYKLFQLDGEMMAIANLNIRMKAPPISLPVDYSGRIEISKEICYKYEKGLWVPLSK